MSRIVEEQLLYYDTDSVIYSWKQDQPYIPTGVFLGQMTDELEGDTVVEFVEFVEFVEQGLNPIFI